MKKFKDLIYDYNDIFLAILIIIIAAAVIFVKVSDIMSYPSFAKNQQEQQDDIDFSDINLDTTDVDPVINDGTENFPENQDTQTTPEPVQNEDPQPQPAGDISFEVKQGEFLSNVASNLKSLGLIEDSKKFVSTVESMGLASKLQIGSFKIPAGSSMEDIAKIITRTK